MLRKAVWTALYAAFGAVATMLARRVASAIWVAATHEDPPARR